MSAAALAVIVLGSIGCGSATPSSTNGSDNSPVDVGPSAADNLPAPQTAAVATAPPNAIAGAWSAKPLPLGDAQIAVVSDACATAARDKLGEAEAELPTAVVDARGQGVVMAILSDGGLGIDCFGHLTEAAATVDGVDRLAVDSVEPVDKADIALTELTVVDDGASQRTIAFGRYGADAASVRVTLAGGATVAASSGSGWWAGWWQGTTRATSFESLGPTGGVVATVPAPGGEIESRLGPASWWLDPGAPKPPPDAVTLSVLIHETSCASGKSGADRVDPPSMEFDDTSITIRIEIRRRPGVQDCQSNAPFKFTLELPEPLGERALLDGGTRPPRDATKPPAG